MNRILDVYLHGICAGQLFSPRGSAELLFSYDAGYLEADRPSLSISLPLGKGTSEGNAVKAFFSGFLPDDIVRHRLAGYLGISEGNVFALLEAVGGECAGAVSLYPSGARPPEENEGDVEILDERKLSEILRLLEQRPLLADYDGLRMSLAGAQDKIAVSVKDGKIALVRGTVPTTHILKPAVGDLKDTVQNELFCMRLAHLVGIETPEVGAGWSDDVPYLLVERYDRVTDKEGLTKRLHQEDFCQALGIAPDIRYEREGGPGISSCMELLRGHSLRPAADQLDFLKKVIFNYLIGNADAHAKNFSLLYRARKPELAPSYDLLNTAVYSRLSRKMAMKIGKRYDPERIFPRDWRRLVPDTAVARKNLEELLLTTARSCLENAPALRSSLEKEVGKSPIFADICSIIERRAKLVEKQIKNNPDR